MNKTKTNYNLKKQRRGSSKKRLVLIVLLILLLATAGILAYKNRARDTTVDTESIVTDANGINLDPPTEEEKNPARDDTTPPSQNSPAGPKQQVKPIITSADNKEVRAYVPGIIEEGGSCVATFTHGQDKVTATSSSFANVSHTTCKPMTLDGPLNISGKWTVVVSYSSSSYEGSSEPFTFEVQ